jgi:hypothetical protein
MTDGAPAQLHDRRLCDIDKCKYMSHVHDVLWPRVKAETSIASPRRDTLLHDCGTASHIAPRECVVISATRCLK